MELIAFIVVGVLAVAGWIDAIHQAARAERLEDQIWKLKLDRGLDKLLDDIDRQPVSDRRYWLDN